MQHTCAYKIIKIFHFIFNAIILTVSEYIKYSLYTTLMSVKST